MLTRIIAYANKMITLHSLLKTVTEVTNPHDNCSYGTGLIIGSLMTMALCRLGSFNVVGSNRGKKIWKQLMGGKNKICSADTLGRRSAAIDVESVRNLLRIGNRKMRRSKAFQALREGNHTAVVMDGHEINCSYLRDFGDSICLEREIPQKDGSTRTQYYQRLVTAVLVCKGHTQLLDMEMQLPGESEVTTALRLLQRICIDYGTLFNVVMADGLYAQAPFFKAVRKMNKHVIAVLKDERRDLTQDVRLLVPQVSPQQFRRGDNDRIKVQAWDIEELTSWPQTKQPIRVVRTKETKSVFRQAYKKKNYNPVSLKRLLSSGCGSQQYPVRNFPQRTLSILPIIGGISKISVSMN